MIATVGAHGGLRLEGHKERSTETPIALAPPPECAILPLDQHAGMRAEPVVKVGERVMLGQPIARPQGEISAWLHASISGRVATIEPRPAAHRAGDSTLSIVIESDGRDERWPAHTSMQDFRERDPIVVLEHIARAGIVGLGGAAFPAATKLMGALRSKDCTLLLNGAECEPYISCDEMLMRERAHDIVLGAEAIAHAIGASQCVVAIEEGSSLAEATLREAVSRASAGSIRVAIVPNVYPAGGERQLIATLFGREVPFAGLPTDIGIVCQNVGTAAAVAKWIQDAQPLVSRIVTVTGDGVRRPRNLEARIGTPFSQLIAACDGYTERMHQLLMGGTMMGIALPSDDVSVVKATNCIIAASALDLQPRAAEMPCIRCGNCSEVCPARLLPQQIHLNARASDLEGLERYGLMDCIECGCCDYVCPSQIPLVERFRAAKPELAKHLMARSNARDARLRYETRNERLERLEAEQRQKLEEKRRQARTRSP